MNGNAVTNRAKTFGKVAALSVGALGLYGIGGALVGLWRTISAHDSLSGSIFMFIFTGGMIVVGGWCLLLGYRAWSNMSSHVVRRLSLVAAVFFCVVLMVVAEKLGILGEEAFSSPILFPLLLIVGGVFYLLHAK